MTMTAGAVLRDRFRIDGTLGAGHSSTTYLAFDTESGVSCVVKELSVARAIDSSSEAQSYDPADFTKVVELFEREARILSHLAHPGVPRLIDHFTDESGGDTHLYTVQEHIEGQTLQALVEGGRHFSEAEARQFLRRTAEILDHLHQLSPPLVHRDIKPSNILIGPGDSVHLIDFGAVKTAMATDDLDGKTIVGTFGYMPIEQYEARALPASDIYALGGTMVYLLSHRAPHELPRQGLKLDFRSHVNVSGGFAELIARMMEPDWQDRHQSGGELLHALGAVDSTVPGGICGRVGRPAGGRQARGPCGLSPKVPRLRRGPLGRHNRRRDGGVIHHRRRFNRGLSGAGVAISAILGVGRDR